MLEYSAKLIEKKMNSLQQTDDLRIKKITQVNAPEILHELFPITNAASSTITNTRNTIKNILNNEDDRILVVIGPCSIHDPIAAREYASNLRPAIEQYKNELLIVMRVYFEKPRTTVGWKGLINDPNLDNSFAINKGLREARSLLVDLNNQGIPCATEFLDLISPQYIADLISWGAIGARTTESQGHRELASGISCPIGFKNGTDGGFKIATDAVGAANNPHIFLSLTKQGHSAIFETAGNQDCHIILRGGGDGPNYTSDYVKLAAENLASCKVQTKLMIDCSHANSNKQHKNQLIVALSIKEQLANNEQNIMGAMVESNLVAGKQNISDKLVYGQSVTDACLGWQDSLGLLKTLAEGVIARRNV
jgi:3-deoxy-7-phosphoheptulonate synthase